MAQEQQVGGTHYKKMPVDPITFCSANRYDLCAFSAMKYLMRFDVKGGSEDLDKAIHFIRYRSEIMENHYVPQPQDLFKVRSMIDRNHFYGAKASVIEKLHIWVVRSHPAYYPSIGAPRLYHPGDAAAVIAKISDLQLHLYGKKDQT